MCDHEKTKIIHKGILYGYYCLKCETHLLPEGYEIEQEDEFV